MKRILFFVHLLPLGLIAQTLDQVWASDTMTIPGKSKIVIVQKVGFINICNALLDAGYRISTKDNELQTVTTHKGTIGEILDIRVKDSIATIKPFATTSNFTLEAYYDVNKKGKTKYNAYTYAFLKAVEVARRSRGQITYTQ